MKDVPVLAGRRVVYKMYFENQPEVITLLGIARKFFSPLWLHEVFHGL